MSRPARRSGEYGFRPAIGSVVLFWKNRGMISTAPPMLITRVTRAISSQGFLSIHACENFICFMLLSGVRRVQFGDAGDGQFAAAQGHVSVVAHDAHARQIQQATS